MANKRKAAQAKRKSVETTPWSRRRFLKLARNGAVGAAVMGGGGIYAFSSFEAYAAEHDLTRVGKGKPVVVQVHDPQCPTCTALQKQTRKALKEFGECDLVYLVADIKTIKGQAFAARYRVPHVTLMLFDGAGELKQTLQGMRRSDELTAVFADHHAASL